MRDESVSGDIIIEPADVSGDLTAVAAAGGVCMSLPAALGTQQSEGGVQGETTDATFDATDAPTIGENLLAEGPSLAAAAEEVAGDDGGVEPSSSSDGFGAGCEEADLSGIEGVQDQESDDDDVDGEEVEEVVGASSVDDCGGGVGSSHSNRNSAAMQLQLEGAGPLSDSDAAELPDLAPADSSHPDEALPVAAEEDGGPDLAPPAVGDEEGPESHLAIAAGSHTDMPSPGADVADASAEVDHPLL
jgi:hypothetical protein